MSMVECMICGIWVASDEGGGAYQKDAPFDWKCDECLGEDCEKADDHGYIVPDQDALNDAAEAAWERQQSKDLECPPVTMQEQYEAAWKQKRSLR